MCGRLTLSRDEPTPDKLLARLAFAKGITGRPTPMHHIPLVTGPAACVIARWGWPSSRGGILTHARIETASTLPTWRETWRLRRGVIPVDGWEEGSWVVTSPGAHIAVLWTVMAQTCALPSLHSHRRRINTSSGSPCHQWHCVKHSFFARYSEHRDAVVFAKLIDQTESSVSIVRYVVWPHLPG